MPAERKLVFVSSSADMAGERAAVREVIQQLASLPLNREQFEPLLWERAMEDGTIAKDAAGDLQKQITPRLEESALVILLFGERVGMPLTPDTELPAGFEVALPVVRGIPGPGQVPLTGTVFEFLYARHLQKRVLVFVKAPREAFDAAVDPEKVNFGYGHHLNRLLADARKAGAPDLPRTQRREYEQQTDWLANLLRHFFVQRAGCDTFETVEEFRTLLRTRLAEQLGFKQTRPGNPFRGLSSYGLQHAAQFFGRKADRDGFLDRLEDYHGAYPLVLLTGRSGSGKSSLLRAGIVADLQAGIRPSLGSFSAIVVVPGDLLATHPTPLEALAARLADARWECFSGELQYATWRELGIGHRARTLVEAIMHRHVATQRRLFVALDQSEEIVPQWRAGDTQSPWHELVDFLKRLSESGAGLAVVAINEAWRPAVVERLGLLCQPHELLEVPLAAPISMQLDEIIKLPFADLGLTLDPRLVNDIRQQIRDVAQNDESPLPLVSLTLSRLYEAWEKSVRRTVRKVVREPAPVVAPAPSLPVGTLTHAMNEVARADAVLGAGGAVNFVDYDAFKSHINLHGVIASIADEALASLSRNQDLDWRLDQLFPRLFRSLVHLEGGFETLRDGLYPDDDVAMRELVDELLRHRLLRLSASGRIRIAHQTLLQSWARARQWLEQERGDLQLLEQLRPQAEVWHSKGRQDKYLLSRETDAAGSEYDSAEQLFAHWWDDLEPLLRSFIEQSLLRAFTSEIAIRGDGTPRLNHAVGGSSLPLVQRYLSLGADPNARDPENRSGLFMASWRSNPDIARALIDAGADVNLQSAGGYTPLAVACFLGNTELATVLLQRGAIADLDFERGRTALFEAARNGHVGLIGMLVAAGACLDQRYAEGVTPLMTAAARGHEAAIERLIAAGADAKLADQNGNTAFMFAAGMGHEPASRVLLRPAELNAQNSDGWTALLLAANAGHENVVRLLLAQGAAAGIKGDDDWTALMAACSGGHRSVAELLLSAGALVGERSSKGATALTMSALYGHSEVVELLLAKGADINVQDTGDETPLMFAIRNRHDDMVRVLLGYGARVDEANQNGATALMLAAHTGTTNAVRMLIEAGADLRMSHPTGLTLLHFAAGGGQVETTRLLLDLGVQIEARDKEDRTPLMKAAAEGQEATARLLLDAGANIKAHTQDGMTPLMHAAVSGREAATAMLLARGAPVDDSMKDGSTALMGAAEQGHAGTIGILLDAGATADGCRADGLTALAFAVRGDHQEAARRLIKHGASVDLPAMNGITPLMLAAYKGSESLVDQLIVAGANIHALVNGTSALTSAIAGGHHSVARLLIDRGVKVDSPPPSGATVLMTAAFNSEPAMLRVLLAAGAPVNHQIPGSRQTALMHAAQAGKEDNVRLLLEHGAEVDAADEYGWTSLMRAVRHGNVASARVLIDAGAAIEARTSEQATPFMLAAAGGQKASLLLLRELGVDIHARDTKGSTARSYARENGHDGIALQLAEMGIEEAG